MENNTIELALMEQEERELVEFILKTIPETDKTSAATPEHPSGYTLTPDDVLFVLDMMDDYLEEQGLLREDPESGEISHCDEFMASVLGISAAEHGGVDLPPYAGEARTDYDERTL